MHDHEEERATVTDIAVRAKLIGRCSTCEHVWDLGEVEHDDTDGLTEIIGAMRENGDEDAEAFTDERLVELLADVIREAAVEKQCAH